jgi:hypothetical protein
LPLANPFPPSLSSPLYTHLPSPFLPQDLPRLGRWLGKGPLEETISVTRASHGETKLSPLARANIRACYNKSNPDYPASYFSYVSADYEAMRELVRLGLLDADRYDLT